MQPIEIMIVATYKAFCQFGRQYHSFQWPGLVPNGSTARGEAAEAQNFWHGGKPEVVSVRSAAMLHERRET